MDLYVWGILGISRTLDLVALAAFLFFLFLFSFFSRIRWCEDGYGVMCYYLSLYPWFSPTVSYQPERSKRIRNP